MFFLYTLFHRFCYIWAGNLKRKVTRCTTLQFFYIFRLRSNLHKDRVVCRILKYDLQACEDVNIPGPPPVLLNWLHRSSVFSLWHRFLYFFPSGPLCCLSLRSSSNSRPSTSLMLLTALWLYLPTLLAFSHQESHQSPALARACWLWEPWEVSHTCRWRMKKTTMT